MLDHLKRLLKGSAIYGIGNALNQFINLLLLPLFTSYLTPADYGVTSILSMFTLVIYNVFTLGFGTSIGLTYFQNKEGNIRSQVIWTSFIMLLVSGILSVVAGVFFADDISFLLFEKEEYGFFVILTIITTFFTMIIMPLMLRLQFEERQTEFVLLTIVSTIVNIGLNIVLIVVLKRGLSGRIEANMLASIVSFLLYLFSATRKVGMIFNFKIGKDLVKYGIPMIPSFVALYILQQGNVYMLQNFSSLNNVGLYSIGSSFASATLLIFSAFNTAWFPFAMSFEQKRDEATLLFGKIFTYYVIGAGLLSGLLYLVAYPIVKLFTQPEFQSAYLVIGLISTAFSLLSAFSIIIIPLYYAKQVKYLAIIQIISSVIFILTGLFLIPTLNIRGAAINLIIGYFAMLFLANLWCNKKSKDFRIAYEWRRIVPFLGIYSLFILNTIINKRPSLDLIFNFVIYFSLALSLLFIITNDEKRLLKDSALKILVKAGISSNLQNNSE